MKKMAVVIIAILITMSIAHTVSASGSVGITIGYGKRGFTSNFNMPDPTIRESDRRAITIGISAGIYVVDRLSIAFNGTYLMGKHSVKYNDVRREAPSFSGVNLHLFGRYDVLASSKYKIGVQVGAIYELLKDRMDFSGSGTNYEVKHTYEGTLSTISIAAGIYGEVEVLPKLSIFANAKIPIVEWKSGDAVAKLDRKVLNNPLLDDVTEYQFSRLTENTFWKKFMYDIELGLKYQINPKVSVGLFGHISNINMDVLSLSAITVRDNGFTNSRWERAPLYSSPAFSIRLGAEYAF